MHALSVRCTGLNRDVVSEISQSSVRGYFRTCRMAVLDEKRNDHICAFGWAIFKKADIEWLSQALREISGSQTPDVIEMGAGSGWLAFLLQQHDVHVAAYDICFGGTWVDGWKRFPWYNQCVKEGSTEKLASCSPSSILLLCWPDLDSKFGLDCLQQFPGSVVVFIGEHKDGCCADDSFFAELENSWEMSKTRKMGHYPEIDDGIYIYRRRM